MTTQTLRSLIGNHRPKVGTFLFEFATPGIGQILKTALRFRQRLQGRFGRAARVQHSAELEM